MQHNVDNIPKKLFKISSETTVAYNESLVTKVDVDVQAACIAIGHQDDLSHEQRVVLMEMNQTP